MDTAEKRLTSLILNVFRLNGVLTDWGDAFVSGVNLTSTRWRMLGAVALSEHPLTAPQIAAMMGVTRQGAQKQLNILVESGLLKIISNPLHKRSPIFVLTGTGRDVFEGINQRWKAHAQSIASAFNAEQLSSAYQILDELINVHTLSVRPEQ